MSHRWIAGYGIDRSLVRPWLEHQGENIEGLDMLDMMSRFTFMIFPTFVPEYLKSLAPIQLAGGEKTLILVRSFGRGTKKVNETENDREFKRLLLEHSGLEDHQLKWESLRTR